MKINIIAIGKFAKNCPNKELFFNYLKRNNWPIKLTELVSKNYGSITQNKEKEAILIKHALTDDAKNILLDEKGLNLSSLEFAQKISNFQNQSVKNLNFIIGGAYGVSEDIKNIADLIISLGKMTLPHMMVRPIIAEQLYRTNTIINNHPYHKE